METSALRRPAWRGHQVLLAHATIVAAAAWPFVFFHAAIGLIDLPNAIGRVGIGLRLLETSAPHPFYQLTFKLIPNMAVDLFGLLLGPFIGAEAAVNVFAVVSIVGFYAAVQVLRLALGSQSSPIIGALSMFILYGLAFRWGFINYTFGSALMIWAVARFERQMRHPARGFAFSQLGLLSAIYLTSLIPAVLYLIYAATRLLPGLSKDVSRRCWDGLKRLIVDHGSGAVCLAVLFLLSTTPPLSNQTEWTWSTKTSALAALFWFREEPLEISVGLAVFMIGIFVVLRAKVRVPPAQALAIGALAATFFVVPFWLGGVAFVDSRIPGTVCGLLLGCLTFRPAKALTDRVLAAGLLVACLLKPVVFYAQVLPTLRAGDSLPALFAHIPERSVLATVSGPGGALIGGQIAWNLPLAVLSGRDLVFNEIFGIYFLETKPDAPVVTNRGWPFGLDEVDRTFLCTGLTHLVLIGASPSWSPRLPLELVAREGDLAVLRIRHHGEPGSAPTC